jgi:WD40 repeat protein
VKLWDVGTHQELLTLASEGSIIESVAFTPYGNQLLGLNREGELHIWQAPSWEEIQSHQARAGIPPN